MYEIETQDLCKYTAQDLETRCDAGRHSKDGNKPLPIVRNKKVTGMMKGDLVGKIMMNFVALRAKVYPCRKLDEKLEDKHHKGAETCVKICVYLLKVKQYKESKFCLTIKSTKCTQ